MGNDNHSAADPENSQAKPVIDEQPFDINEPSPKPGDVEKDEGRTDEEYDGGLSINENTK